MTIALVPSASDGLNGGSHGCRNSDCVWVVSSTAFDSVTRGEESVETLNQVRMASEELRNSVDDPRRIDATSCQYEFPFLIAA